MTTLAQPSRSARASSVTSAIDGTRSVRSSCGSSPWGQALAFTPLLVDVPVPQQWSIDAATVIGLLCRLW